jgi:phospholipase C
MHHIDLEIFRNPAGGLMKKRLLPLLLSLPLSIQAADNAADIEKEKKLQPIKHIVVFYLENHSFDNLFGTFPGADGLADAKDKTIQTDKNGKPYATLPIVMDGKKPDKRFPDNLPNQPFSISKYVPDNDKTGDLTHRFYQLQMQMNDGKMDKFAEVSNAGALTMGYYEDKNSPLWQYAQKYTLADHFFTGATGGSYINHMMLVCACVPNFPNAPKELHAVLGKHGLIKDGALTPDGYAVNTIESVSEPHNFRTPKKDLLPLQTMPTIGDRLSERNFSWAWYSGGWREADAGIPGPSFQFHHQPFAYFANYAHGTQGRKDHLLDELDFIIAIESGNLPSVAFYKPIGEFNLHPGYSNMANSEEHIFKLIDKIEHSPQWKSTIVIVTFDDAGGFYDHVMPPKVDRFGPGERVPTLIISPFAKRGFIDHTIYDTTSILKLIEEVWRLPPLTKRDAQANDMLNALEVPKNYSTP